MEAYDQKSCNALEKPYYRPIEAALRWCGLIAHEAEILRETRGGIYPHIEAFPQWPCLRANAEKIHDAIMNGEIPYGRDGRTVADDDHVAEPRRTVRHTDLKAWMAKHYPDQKPQFLFDEIERGTHSAINADAFRALQADRDALKVRLAKAKEAYLALKADRDAIENERALTAQREQGEPSKDVATRERNTLLTIIAALCKEAGIDFSKPAKAAGVIQSTAAKMGVSIGETTIEGHLKKIPDALGTRMK